jgi:hypothetical protein
MKPILPLLLPLIEKNTLSILCEFQRKEGMLAANFSAKVNATTRTKSFQSSGTLIKNLSCFARSFRFLILKLAVFNFFQKKNQMASSIVVTARLSIRATGCRRSCRRPWSRSGRRLVTAVIICAVVEVIFPLSPGTLRAPPPERASQGIQRSLKAVAVLRLDGQPIRGCSSL